jgi:transcriptional regulator with XRE-family HTH domain
MNGRIKQVRKLKKLSQTAFGEPLGASRDMINNVENGRAAVSDMMIAAICRVYNVDEVWLRTGTGQPFPKKSRRDVIDEYIGQLSEGKRSDIEQLLIEFMAETSVEEWKELSAVFRRLADKLNKPDTE